MCGDQGTGPLKLSSHIAEESKDDKHKAVDGANNQRGRLVDKSVAMCAVIEDLSKNGIQLNLDPWRSCQMAYLDTIEKE